ncbi:unnamed protein product [Brassica napus]|uniref:(rape) hypothetical protein n=1 Tax=Brassica napus TaxID=3708 RepID=A0A816M7N9_BRANA|nr:unnamed protein product [Brassica napus]
MSKILNIKQRVKLKTDPVMMMSRCDAEEDPSQTKKRKQSPSSGLPEEMVLSCLARVSRSEHASLSLVSKRHRSLLTTPELYKFRTLLGCTENLIHLCLRIPPDPNPGWFTLSLKPLDRRLVPVRSYFYQPLDAASMVAHGCGIYAMGGRIGGRASSQCHVPGLSISHVEHSPLHGGASIFSCVWCGGREDIHTWRV